LAGLPFCFEGLETSVFSVTSFQKLPFYLLFENLMPIHNSPADHVVILVLLKKGGRRKGFAAS
jgi:hypothetical protein